MLKQYLYNYEKNESNKKNVLCNYTHTIHNNFLNRIYYFQNISMQVVYYIKLYYTKV